MTHLLFREPIEIDRDVVGAVCRKQDVVDVSGPLVADPDLVVGHRPAVVKALRVPVDLGLGAVEEGG